MNCTWCTCYSAVRERHEHLFEVFGGRQHVCDRQIDAQQLQAFMSQVQYQVAAFLYDCAQRRWRDPPGELMFAECSSC